jgi:hypothetical protein
MVGHTGLRKADHKEAAGHMVPRKRAGHKEVPRKKEPTPPPA